MESVALVTDNWHVEDAGVTQARERGLAAGLTQPSPTLGAFLRALTSALAAESVVAIGADSGVGGLYLSAGMSEGSTLTVIEPSPTNDRAAREALRAAPSGRVRFISGDPHEVVSRLTDAAYDLVVVSEAARNRADYLQHARRLLRDGGTAVFLGVFGSDDEVLDQARREPHVMADRRFLDEVMESDELRCALLPLDHGTLIIEIR